MMKNIGKQIRTAFIVASLFCSFQLFAQDKLTQQQKWDLKVANYLKQDSINPPGKNVILFTGSSSIENWKTLKEDFPTKNVLNRGISGTQTTNFMQYIDKVVTPYKAKQIFLYEGDNDIGFKKTPQEILQTFTVLFNAIRKDNKQAEIIYMSIKPSPRRLKDSSNIEQTNLLIKDFLKDKKNTAYADMYYPLLTADKKLMPEYYREDGLHLTAAGYKVWADAIRPFIK